MKRFLSTVKIESGVFNFMVHVPKFTRPGLTVGLIAYVLSAVCNRQSVWSGLFALSTRTESLGAFRRLSGASQV